MPTTAPARQRKKSSPSRHDDEAPIIPILARKVREVESKAQRNKLGPTNRVKFQVIAFLVREERTRVKEQEGLPDAVRAELLKRLDGVATILAKTAARDTSLIQLLGADHATSPVARRLRRDWLLESGAELQPEDLVITDDIQVQVASPIVPAVAAERAVTPPQIEIRREANPFLAPDFSRAAKASSGRHRLDGWELMGPLYKSFEQGAGGGSATMPLPELPEFDHLSPKGLEIMPHQSRFLEAVRAGHREFLLADEPGLGKTAESVLAAAVANAYPLVVVVPNVVKMNWAREVERWTPGRRATVINGDGDDVDAFADVFIVNYEILDRHLAWLSTIGLRGMVVDEAHFIKNLTSQRSQNVLALAQRVRQTTPGGKPLLLALTGTPLINDVEDFDAIWRFLGWTNGEKPGEALMAKLDATGLTPADKSFYPEAREAVISMGIVRRRKKDVAKDLPDKLIADLPVELDDEYARGIKAAERELGARLAAKYRRIVDARTARHGDTGSLSPSRSLSQSRSLSLSKGDIDEDIVRLVAQGELEESKAQGTGGDNVFTMVRRIGQAKAQLAADYAVQLQRSVGKVVFFAKHIDVMDQAEAHFASLGIRSVSVRGEQTTAVRQAAIDAFNDDPDVGIAVCSLTAAGVGVNMQASSNVVLAELSWTAAEQTQAIDRVHRIGQDEPVTAWRIIAAHTIDTKIAELIDRKQGLAGRALDGEQIDETSSDSVQLEALMHLLRRALGA
ncbi:MAG: DEAD/DEAH box helicase [Microbacterium sp.]